MLFRTLNSAAWGPRLLLLTARPQVLSFPEYLPRTRYSDRHLTDLTAFNLLGNPGGQASLTFMGDKTEKRTEKMDKTDSGPDSVQTLNSTHSINSLNFYGSRLLHQNGSRAPSLMGGGRLLPNARLHSSGLKGPRRAQYLSGRAAALTAPYLSIQDGPGPEVVSCFPSFSE